MRNKNSLFFTKIIYLLFTIGTILSIFIVYKNINNTFAIGFVIGYAIFCFVFLFYVIFLAFLNGKKLKWIDIKGRLFKFIVSFIIFGTLNYILDCFFSPSNIDLFKNFSIAFGVSFGISFTDVIFFKKKEN